VSVFEGSTADVPLADAGAKAVGVQDDEEQDDEKQEAEAR
jgi:hypothetical protein